MKDGQGADRVSAEEERGIAAGRESSSPRTAPPRSAKGTPVIGDRRRLFYYVRVSALESPEQPSSSRAGGAGVRWTAAILLIVALAAAVSVDVVKTGFGNKGDEATYVSMALSVAFDHDLN